MCLATVHNNVILLNYCDTTDLIIISLFLVLIHMLLWMTVELLALNYMASKHLRILNLNLRVIEYIIIVIDVLDNLNWLILTLLLRFR